MERLSAERSTVSRAVYAGSFDPPTNGHLWVIETGAELFDELHVAVAVNPIKKSMFTMEERVEMLEEIARPFGNVTIGNFENKYTVRYAKELGYNYLLRGLRNADDFNSEKTLSSLNSDIEPKIRTFYVAGPDELLKVSSSNVKNMMGPEDWEHEIERYVPQFVLGALVKRFEELKVKD
jgi:pantetheine-phosphate adenylyltransferase